MIGPPNWLLNWNSWNWCWCTSGPEHPSTTIYTTRQLLLWLNFILLCHIVGPFHYLNSSARDWRIPNVYKGFLTSIFPSVLSPRYWCHDNLLNGFLFPLLPHTVMPFCPASVVTSPPGQWYLNILSNTDHYQKRKRESHSMFV